MYLKFQRLVKDRLNLFRVGDKVSKLPETVLNIPPMLAASPLRQEYDKPELAETASRQAYELSAWQAYELSAWHAAELPVDRDG